MSRVTLDGVTKIYRDSRGRETAVEDASFTVEDGEFVVIVGPSGCGKSTTLRMIAGLETVTDGTIQFDGEEVQHLTPTARDVAMVFQNYALYPSMNARENIAYGLKHSTSLSKSEREKMVNETAAMLDIEDVMDHRPNELSGGQRQRVALGRAIVREPNVFLLDEPLSNLDAKLRSRMRHELQTIHDELEITTIYVTHDQKEAMTMADRIIILHDGVIQQIDSVENMYNRPTNRFVGEFIGSPAMNTMEVDVQYDGDDVILSRKSTPLATLPREELDGNPDRIVAGIRPEHIVVDEPGVGALDASVQVAEYQGKSNFIHLELVDQVVTARTPPHLLPRAGDDVSMSFSADDLYLFDLENGETIKPRYGEELTQTDVVSDDATVSLGGT